MRTGWFWDGFYNSWFYLDAGGAMKTGWHLDTFYGGWFYLSGSGAMVTGIVLIDGLYNEFAPSGVWKRYLDPTVDPPTDPPTQPPTNPSVEPVFLHKMDYLSREGTSNWYIEETIRINTGEYLYNILGFLLTEPSQFVWSGTGGTRDYYIDNKYKKFTGIFFLHYDFRSATKAAKFNIWGDGKLLYVSEDIKAGFLPTTFEIDITGIKLLKIGIEYANTRSNSFFGSTISSVGIAEGMLR